MHIAASGVEWARAYHRFSNHWRQKLCHLSQCTAALDIHCDAPLTSTVTAALDVHSDAQE
eukprot:1157725-Pelagomonas_calceolata.AAC.3